MMQRIAMKHLLLLLACPTFVSADLVPLERTVSLFDADSGFAVSQITVTNGTARRASDDGLSGALIVEGSGAGTVNAVVHLPDPFLRHIGSAVYVQLSAGAPKGRARVEISLAPEGAPKWQAFEVGERAALLEHPQSLLPPSLAGRNDVRLSLRVEPADDTVRAGLVIDDIRLVLSTIRSTDPITPSDVERQWYRLDGAPVTPHTAWAKPLAKGTIRALVIAPRLTAREIVELQQRFDVECEPVLTWHYRDLGIDGAMGGWESKVLPAGLEVNIVRRLESLLDEPFDVIVLSFDWSALPERIRERIADKVRGGCGLLAISAFKELEAGAAPLDAEATDAARPLQAVPFTTLPAVQRACPDKSAADLVRAYRLGDGRIVALDWMEEKWRERWYLTSLTPNALHAEYRPAYYEYYQSVLGRAVRLAAGRSPEVSIESIGRPAPDEDGRVTLSFKLGVDGEPAAPMTLTARVVDLDGQSHATTSGPAAPDDDGMVQLTLEPVPHGAHFVEAWLKTGDRVVDWAWDRLEVRRAAHVRGIGIDRKIFKAGEPVRVLAVVLGRVTPGMTLDLDIRDVLGRRVAHRRLPVEQAGDQRHTFELPRPLTVLHSVIATLRRDDVVISRKTHDFAIRTPPPEYPFVVWSGSGNTHIDNLGLKAMRRAGIDVAYVQTRGGHGVPEVLWGWLDGIVRQDMRIIPYAAAIGYHGMGPIRRPCLTDPSYHHRMKRELQGRAPVLDAFDTIGYSLGDENNVGRKYLADICHSETCQAAFRDYLKEVYGDLDALNGQWETDYETWDAVPIMNMETAKEHGNPSPWSDHHQFKDTVLARTQNRFRQYILEKVRHARVGFEGLGGDVQSFRGRDLWKLTREMDLVGSYSSPMFLKRFKSFARPGALMGIWIGGSYIEGVLQIDEARYRVRTWRPMFEGFNSSWYYESITGVGAVLTPTHDRSIQFDLINRNVQEIKRGVFTLLSGAQPARPRVAICYSQPSSHADAIVRRFHGHELSWFPTVNAAWVSLLDDLGVPFEYVSTAEIADGALSEREYQALVLPYVQSLSDTETAAIRRFVDKGGWALADLRPGVMDEHGRYRPQRRFLPDLFGIKIDDFDALQPMDRIDVSADSDLGWSGSVRMRAQGDRITVTGAQVLGASQDGTPAVMINRVGAGRGVLLNFSVDNYGSGRGQVWVRRYLALTEGTDELALLMRAILEEAEIRTAVSLTALDRDGVARGCSLHGWTDGPARYAGVVFDHGVPERHLGDRDLEVRFPATGEIFDVRAKRFAGSGDATRFKLSRGGVKLFAQLPYRPTDLSVTAATAVQPGQEVRVDCRLARDGQGPWCRHVVRIDVFDPSGQSARHYSGNIELTDGEGNWTFPTALDDDAGRWRIVATEVVSGERDEAIVQVRPTRN
ncbi:MAG: hypothetical protein CMJ18_19920 [Phycisphaeraceae bacterium]|nr:hypothetical protein [Phycisphaeraceae bacterium]